MEYSPEAQMAATGIGIGIILFYLIFYIFWSFCIATIAKKLGRPFGTSFLMAIIPIVNLYLLLQLSNKPWWWLFLFLIPIVNIVFLIMMWMALAEARGKPAWWGVMIGIVPFANIVFFLMLSFSDGGVPVPKAA
jgi:hypothetical protein